MDLTARKLILDLLTTVRRGAMPVRALVEAGELFGFAANNTRVSLSKLTSEGRVDRDERGRYRLSPAVAALSRQLRNWRKIEEQQRAWRGGWIAVHRSRRGRGAGLTRSQRALALLGFREFDRGLDIRPDNLVGGMNSVRDRLSALTANARRTEKALPSLVFRLDDFDAASEERARGLWDIDAMTEGYRDWKERLDTSRKGLGRLSPEAAMVETFLVGGGAVRHLHFDPLLPVPLLDPKPRQALVAAARSYDELGRLQWSPFMTSHGVPNFGAREAWRAELGEIPGATWEGMRRER